MKITEADMKAIAGYTANALRREREDCEDRAGSCLIYTSDQKQVELHLEQHAFLKWLIGWLDPARRETKSIIIKIFVYGLIAAFVAAVILFSPISIKWFK